MLDQLKREVADANRELAAKNLAALTWGNVSGVSPDRALMVIKPSGVPYDRLEPSQLAVVDLASGKEVEGKFKPSTDAPTHRLLYQAFANVGGITHTHSPRATAFAQARCELPCLGTTHADHFYGSVPVTRQLTREEIEQDYEENTARVIIERFTEARLDPLSIPAVLVAGHAPFAWGRDAAESLANAIALEAVAAMALDTLTLRHDQQPLEPFLLEKHFRRKHGTDAYYGQS